MTPSMNLASTPWIPVVDAAGRLQKVSLEDCFRHGADIADLDVRPHERVALMRLLTCLCHAALNGPPNEREYRTARTRLPEAALAYLQEWHDAFWLFHPERPFLQIAGLAKDRKDKAGKDPLTPFSKLDFALAAGNKSTLFDHAALGPARRPPDDVLALSLLTFQNFSLGGLISQVLWAGTLTAKSANDAPCAPGSMLHVCLRGSSLLDTLVLNLCPVSHLAFFYHQGKDWWGRPLWERFPASPDDAEAVRNATTTYLGRLVPLSRAVLFREYGMMLGEGLVYPSFSNPKRPFPPEPSATVIIRKVQKKDAKVLLSYDPDRAVWRQLHAIAVRRDTDGGTQPHGPLALNNVRPDTLCDVVASALPRDQADVIDSAESVYPLNPALLMEEGRRQYEAGVREAEEAARCLAWAVDTFRDSLDGSWRGVLQKAGAKRSDMQDKLRRNALLAYWTAVEGDLPLLFASLNAGDLAPLNAWRKSLDRHARDSFHLVAGQLSGSHLKARTRGELRLRRLKKILSLPQTDEESDH